MASSAIQTRVLVLSDTHAYDIDSLQLPKQAVDVAIHCGDLTEGSTLKEFRSALSLLEAIDAPLKLVIPGNHDFSMDHDAFSVKLAESSTPLDCDLVAATYGHAGEAKDLFRQSSSSNVVFLEQGEHEFELQNGAALKVYASAFTPALGAWGFQYHPDKGHDFEISPGTDIVITHGPPKGIMDYTEGRERAGCPDLFAAVARCRPRIHCFGHIHEGWGAKLVTWKDHHIGAPTHFTSIDNSKSALIAKISSLEGSKYDTPEDLAIKANKKDQILRDQCYVTKHTKDDDLPILYGESTLFVNAAICDSAGLPTQKAWLVNIDLPKCS